MAINACAAVVYASRGWGGRVSDKHILASSIDFIATLQQGDEVMAERGFNIGNIVGEGGVTVTIPDFKGQGRSQLKKSEGKRSEKINSRGKNPCRKSNPWLNLLNRFLPYLHS